MSMHAFTLDRLEDAARQVHAVLPPTPQYAGPLLSTRVGAEVWIKHENHTPLAAALKERARNAGRRIDLVLSGGNVDRTTFAAVLAETETRAAAE